MYRIEWAGVTGQGSSPAGSISNGHQAWVFLGLGVVLVEGYGWSQGRAEGGLEERWSSGVLV